MDGKLQGKLLFKVEQEIEEKEEASRNHTYLEPCSFERCKDFWMFGWDEGGLYDVTKVYKVTWLQSPDTPHFGHIFIIPQGIDYALNHTGEDSLYYGGHRCEM